VEGSLADLDSTLVTRYKQAGLVIFGKTNTPELGLTTTTESVLFGETRNPWNPVKTSGGSSGGSAVVVASRILPMAHASDGGGSIRIPASCCGVFGFKPTRGRVPLGPMQFEGWNGLAHQHALTISVRDSAALLDATAGRELGSLYFAPKPARPFLSELDSDPGSLRIVTGQPSMSVPLSWSGEGLPIGVMFSGRFGEDALLFRLGRQLEKAQPWKDRKPKT